MSEPRVTKQDVLDACQTMLRKPLYVVLTKPAQGMGPVLASLDAHLKFQINLEKRGIMFGAGPFWDESETEWLGEGMVIIRASSLAEATAIAAEDPMHKSGARTFTVRPWLLNEGFITVKLSYSDGAVEIV